MNREFEKNLTTCLDSLEQGEPIAAILARYPQEADELRPYLETAVQLPQLASLPSIAAQKQSQARFLAAAAALRSPQAAPTPVWFTLRRLLMPLASLAVILLLLGFTLVTISAASLPGDGLYPVKRGLEQFRLGRASDPEQILNLARSFQQERLREIEALLLAGRQADVTFEGEIESIAPSEWLVAGLPVQIGSETGIEGTPRIGELARVDGRTQDGQLFARQITVLTGSAEPDQTPLPALPPTIEASPTPRPSATPLFTPLPSATAEIQATPTPSPADAAAIQPTPTATAVDQPESPPPANENGDDSTGGESHDGDPAANDSDNSGSSENDNSGSSENDNSGSSENDNSGSSENDNSGSSENDNSGSNENDSSGSNENTNSDSNENDNSDSNENDNSGSSENDNSGSNENDNSGSSENDNSGSNENDNSGGSENDNSGGNENDNSGGSENDNSGSNENDNDNSNSDSGIRDDSTGDLINVSADSQNLKDGSAAALTR